MGEVCVLILKDSFIKNLLALMYLNTSQLTINVLPPASSSLSKSIESSHLQFE
ncbi:hypothetical protein PENVUL_c014G00947 [Penicillium vulpinum]|uniref:Uncharacterized protein n=1 Tax=Penicillium vulpinum TaxID=29845 RepID=A0A1V6S0Q0_9EURO|nr:hypothetical protein PENVUL_c014G00947 [Penicillium vulpinum]